MGRSRAALAFVVTWLTPLFVWAQEVVVLEESAADKINNAFGSMVEGIAPALFYEVPGVKMPLIVLVLLAGSIFYTLYHRFLNVRAFKHAIDVTRGKYDDPNDPGEISHFQALTSALSATVGLGNIAGVAVAVWAGGPGAVFWMMMLGLFGMSAKFHECTLAQMYRQVDDDGVVHGGPMYYLSRGLKERGMAPLGGLLAGVFAVFCIAGSFGGGNMFQANQCFAAIKGQIPALDSDTSALVFGVVLAFLVGLVIIGGIKKIGQVTEKIIPLMVAIYLIAGVVVIIAHIEHVPGAVGEIVGGAFTSDALYGGFIGVLVQGIRRAVFSNEAGVGSAAIAHSAAKTAYPAREGIVSLLEPFIDTVVICAMTGIILVVSGAAGTRAGVETSPLPITIAAGTEVTFLVDGEAELINFIEGGTYDEAGAKEMFGVFLGDRVRSAVGPNGGYYIEAIKNGSIEVQGGEALGIPAGVVLGSGKGVEMTRWAFADTMSWFPWILAICIFLFAYSTMISWSYYGEKAWSYLFGKSKASVTSYRVVFLAFVVIGTVSSLGNVIEFSDLMILSMAFPNIIGGMLLAPTVKRHLDKYWASYKNNEFKVYK